MSVCRTRSGCEIAFIWSVTYRICRPRTDTRHDRDQHVLLDGEGPRVERDAEDLVVRHESSPSPADGEGDELGDDLGVREA